MLKRKVKDMVLEETSFSELIKQMDASGGFGAKNLAKATEIIQTMMNEKDCIKFLSFPACIVATGLRGTIAQMIKKGLVDIIITTCGTLDHDLSRAWKGDYYHGSFHMNDAELRKKKVNRLGNILIPDESHGIVLEKNMGPILEELYAKKKEWSPSELCREFGLRLNDKNSVLFQASKKNIPIHVPGILDGTFGTNLVWFSQEHDFKLDLLKDEKELSEIAFTKKKTGAIIIGGGISKHHTIWWNQFKGGLDYAVYITTATQYDGSLSGARTSEAISWGKVKEDAKHVTVDGDATIILPVILSAIYEKSIENLSKLK